MSCTPAPTNSLEHRLVGQCIRFFIVQAVAVVVTAPSIPVPQNQGCISEANPSANAADSEPSKCFFLNKYFVAMITCLNFKARIQRLLLLTLKSCPTVHGLCLDWFYHSTSVLAQSSQAPFLKAKSRS
ncbi:hypothetical protein LWI28_027243 [Acer negundo]|uniref:Uncharacterized protein n=1 Tax=Acer negundo TaxID=4023 RepID=A0AAD5NQX8_ACENE|nr:hypothetical protein LWI28_027243 [Acer negundo]